MKQWNKLGIGLVAVVLAVAATGGAYAMWGGGDGDNSGEGARQANPDSSKDAVGDDVAAVCVEGAVDCVDTVEGTGGAAGATCLVGAEDCNDTFGHEGGGGLAQCAPGVTDCNDVAVVGTGDCAPDAECVDPDVQCDLAEPCEADCGIGWSEGAPTPTKEEFERAYAECEPAECNDTPDAERCLPPDCAVSSDGSTYCPPQGPPATGGSEPGSTPPDAGAGSEGSSGNPPVTDPAEPQPAP